MAQKIYEGIYAELYDEIYGKKWYLPDCKNIITIFRQHKLNGLILDIGCGTGRHINVLSSAGFEIEGLDCSEDMLKIARKRNPLINFYLMNLDDIPKLHKKYSAIISFGDVFNYIGNKTKLIKGLSAVYEALDFGGFFILGFFSKKEFGFGAPTMKKLKNGYYITKTVSSKGDSFYLNEILLINSSIIPKQHFFHFCNDQLLKDLCTRIGFTFYDMITKKNFPEHKTLVLRKLS